MKSFSLFTLLFSLAFASCSKSDDMPTAPQSEATTFTLAVDELQTPAQAKAATRATSVIAPARYVMEVWSEDGTKAEKVFENGTKNHAQITSGNSFTVTLDKTKAYTCLFWADDNTTFNAASLKAVELNDGKDMTEAYHAKVAVAKGKNPAVAVTLKRAVAKITFTETAAVKTSDNLELKFSNIYPQFSVLDGAATGTAAEWTKTIKPAAENGLIGTLYLFAKPAQELTEFTFTYASEAPTTVSNVPFQQNYKTNIKGEYSNLMAATFTVTADNDWNMLENEVNFPVYKVGDLYPDATAPIGVVFWVDETDASYNSTDKTSAKGKIVGLDEPTAHPAGQLIWGPNPSTTSATNELDGLKNMHAVKTAGSGTFDNYPTFAWVHAKNTGISNLDYSTATTGVWYLPATKELRQLYAAMCGLKWMPSGANTANGEIDDWGNSVLMDKYEDYETALNTFNDLFIAAGKSTIKLNGYYWSSTEDNTLNTWAVRFINGVAHLNGKNYNMFARAVLAF